MTALRAEADALLGEAETLIEEVANAVTHGIGAVLSIAALAVLVAIAAVGGGTGAIVAAAIYGATLIFAYTSSTLYHGVWHRKAKQVLLACDHCAIFLLIAGTYTPITLLALPQPLGWVLCAVLWSLAAGGIALRLCLGRLSLLLIPLFLAMGWLGFLWSGTVLESIGASGWWLLLAGGIAYTGGLIFYAWRRLPFHHMVWHLFVLAGSVLHFFAVVDHVLPRAA
ncbi:MAG TPA: hemolysin III family protein [Alphaproteobacteria bacterium]